MHDLSDIHNFVLGSKATGERLAQTDVEFVGDKTFSFELVPGRYAYACSPHFETMNGRLTVFPRDADAVTTRTLAAKVDARAATLSAKKVAPAATA